MLYIRTEASHDIYDNPKKPLNRPLILRTKYKDIPLMHLHTNLKTLEVSKAEFEKWLPVTLSTDHDEAINFLETEYGKSILGGKS